jgi:hypothetical protein
MNSYVTVQENTEKMGVKPRKNQVFCKRSGIIDTIYTNPMRNITEKAQKTIDKQRENEHA